MNHEEARLAFSRRLDGEIDSGTRLDLESHLASCEECRNYVGEMKKGLGLLGQAAGQGRMPEPLRARILARVRVTPQEAAPGYGVWLLLLGGIVLFAALYAAVRMHGSRKAVREPVSQPILEPLPRGLEEPPLRPREGPPKGLSGAEKRALNTAMLMRMRPMARGGPAEPLPKKLVSALKGAGLQALANDPDAVGILQRRLERASVIGALKDSGSLIEGSDGLLHAGPSKLSEDERHLTAFENLERKELLRLYSENLGKPAAEQVELEKALEPCLQAALEKP